MKTFRMRSIYMNAEAPEVQISDDETIIGADHEGNDWWIYVTQPVPMAATFTRDVT